jgi:endonuclease YncB( thermonuclease family)
LIGGREVLLEEHCVDQHGRTVATLYVEDRKTSRLINVNERMVTLGHAWVMRKYYDHLSNNRKAQLNRLERWARSKSVGLWRTSNPIRPSKWRHDSGSDLI